MPDDFFLRYLSNEPASLLLMLLVGIPLYICASASTPIAATLILKGLSPGAALVLLLAGPATNAATLTVITRQLGRNAAAVYLFAIASSSLLLGWITNRLYAWSGLELIPLAAGGGHESHGILSVTAAILLLLLLARHQLRRLRPGVSDCCDDP